jgi:hypothetical protein
VCASAPCSIQNSSISVHFFPFSGQNDFLALRTVARGVHRVHLENLWGNATIQYKPDVAWIGNRDSDIGDRTRSVRWAVEKNRRGPSDLEFRHAYYGAAYTFERVGEPILPERSWQSERTALVG